MDFARRAAVIRGLLRQWHSPGVHGMNDRVNMQPPESVTPRFDKFPTTLTERRQWLLWRYVLRDNRWTKQPFTYNGWAGKSNDPYTWCSFEQARNICEPGGYSGVGFAFASGDGLCGIDMDHVIDPQTGELIKPEAGELLAQFSGVYCEISPSGTGLRLFCLGKPQRCGKNVGMPKWLEIYDAGSPRYLTVTGHRFGEGEVINGQQALNWVHRRFMVTSATKPDNRPPDASVDTDDAALLERIRRSAQGTKFDRLYGGDAGNDHSSADLALCSILAFWTGGNRERTDRLFRQSGLFREKWDRKHHANGETYGEGTLTKAMQSATQALLGARAAPSKARSAQRPPIPALPPEWPDPILPQTANTPEVSADFLPGWAGDMADAVARSTQTPPVAAVLLVLAVLATVLQRRFVVAPYGSGENPHVESLSFWVLVVMESGSRKTAILNSLLSALARWEKRMADRMRKDIAANQAARAVSEKRIEALKNAAGKAQDAEDRLALQEQLQREIEEMPIEIRPPKLFVGDATMERFQALLVQNDGRLSIFSDEPAVLNTMAGQYSGAPALTTYLQAYTCLLITF